VLDGGPAIKDLQQSCQKLSALLAALVNQDGTSVDYELFFVPPTDQKNQTMTRIFRLVEATAGAAKGRINELSGLEAEDPACRVGKFPLNEGLKLSFRELASSQQSLEKLNLPDWTLVHLIRDGMAESRQDGKNWRFSISLSKGTDEGEVSFEFRLPHALPKKAEWPVAR
jgi:hypothetical protein